MNLKISISNIYLDKMVNLEEHIKDLEREKEHIEYQVKCLKKWLEISTILYTI